MTQTDSMKIGWIIGALMLASCSPQVENNETGVSVSMSSSLSALDAARITDVSTEDKLSVVSLELSPLRSDMTNATAQAARSVAAAFQAGEIAKGSDKVVVATSPSDSTNIIMSLSYSAAELKALNLAETSDAQMLEASDETTFGQAGARDASAWCLAFEKDAPKFCSTARQ